MDSAAEIIFLNGRASSSFARQEVFIKIAYSQGFGCYLVNTPKAGYGSRTRLRGLGSRCITDILTLRDVIIIAPFLNSFKEHSVNSEIRIQFGMKGNADLVFVGGADDMTIDAGQNIYIIFDIFNKWCADKGHRHIPFRAKIAVCMETAKLAPVGIPADSDRKGSKVNMIVVGKLFSEKDESGARWPTQAVRPGFFPEVSEAYSVPSEVFPERCFHLREGQAIDRDI